MLMIAHSLETFNFIYSGARDHGAGAVGRDVDTNTSGSTKKHTYWIWERLDTRWKHLWITKVDIWIQQGFWATVFFSHSRLWAVENGQTKSFTSRTHSQPRFLKISRPVMAEQETSTAERTALLATFTSVPFRNRFPLRNCSWTNASLLEADNKVLVQIVLIGQNIFVFLFWPDVDSMARIRFLQWGSFCFSRKWVSVHIVHGLATSTQDIIYSETSM